MKVVSVLDLHPTLHPKSQISNANSRCVFFAACSIEFPIFSMIQYFQTGLPSDLSRNIESLPPWFQQGARKIHTDLIRTAFIFSYGQ